MVFRTYDYDSLTTAPSTCEDIIALLQQPELT